MLLCTMLTASGRTLISPLIGPNSLRMRTHVGFPPPPKSRRPQRIENSSKQSDLLCLAVCFEDFWECQLETYTGIIENKKLPVQLQYEIFERMDWKMGRPVQRVTNQYGTRVKFDELYFVCCRKGTSIMMSRYRSWTRKQLPSFPSYWWWKSAPWWRPLLRRKQWLEMKLLSWHTGWNMFVICLFIYIYSIYACLQGSF